jgi:hypothetical protein
LLNIIREPEYLSRYREYATDWMTEGLGFDCRKGARFFLFSITSGPAPSPTQPTVQCAPVAVSLGVKQQRREADRSPPSGTEVKNGGAMPPFPYRSSWRGA